MKSSEVRVVSHNGSSLGLSSAQYGGPVVEVYGPNFLLGPYGESTRASYRTVRGHTLAGEQIIEQVKCYDGPVGRAVTSAVETFRTWQVRSSVARKS